MVRGRRGLRRQGDTGRFWRFGAKFPNLGLETGPLLLSGLHPGGVRLQRLFCGYGPGFRRFELLPEFGNLCHEVCF